MGNTESNERKPDYKIYKIVNTWGKLTDGDYIRYYLSDYVTYKNGKHCHIDLKKDWVTDYIFPSGYRGLSEGSYLTIDLNKTSCEHSEHTFKNPSSVVKEVPGNQVIEKRDSNGNFIGFLYDTRDFLNEIGETRERYQIAAIKSRGSNYARIRQTSYDMPPKR